MCNVYMHDTGCSFELDATCCLECVMMAFTSYMYCWYELLVFKLSLAAIGEGLGSVRGGHVHIRGSCEHIRRSCEHIRGSCEHIRGSCEHIRGHVSTSGGHQYIRLLFLPSVHQKEERNRPSYYIQNPQSMLQMTYQSVFMVARKRMSTPTEDQTSPLDTHVH